MRSRPSDRSSSSQHCSSYCFAFVNFPHFDQAEQFRSSSLQHSRTFAPCCPGTTVSFPLAATVSGCKNSGSIGRCFFFGEKVVPALSFRQWSCSSVSQDLHRSIVSRPRKIAEGKIAPICTRCGCSPPGTHWASFHLTSAGRLPLYLVATLVSFLHVRISSLPRLGTKNQFD